MRLTARRCPVCRALLNIHCRTKACKWFVCPREACQAVIDFVKKRGYQILPGDVVRPFTWPNTA